MRACTETHLEASGDAGDIESAVVLPAGAETGGRDETTVAPIGIALSGSSAGRASAPVRIAAASDAAPRPPASEVLQLSAGEALFSAGGLDRHRGRGHEPRWCQAAARNVAERLAFERYELAMSPRERQELLLLRWKAILARSTEEQFDADECVVHYALGALMNRFIVAWMPELEERFQYLMRVPEEAEPVLRRWTSITPDSWWCAYRVATEILEAQKRTAAARGIDRFGWPEEALDAIEEANWGLAGLADEIERISGPLRRPHPRGLPAPSAGAVAEWAKRLRRARRATDWECWAAVGGRLRFWAGASEEYREAMWILSAECWLGDAPAVGLDGL